MEEKTREAKPLNTKNGTYVLNMEHKYQKWNKLLTLLFEHPYELYTLRQISKKVNIPSTTLMRYLAILQREGIIDKEYRFIENPYTRWRKTAHLIDLLFESGLLEFLEKKLKPGVIFLFGSVRKGEYEHTSDIDIFVESTEQEVNVSAFEKKLEHKVHLFVRPRLSQLSKELQLSILNGVKLSGYLNYEL